MKHHESNDQELRRRFAELRRVDETNTPSFAALLRASRQSKAKRVFRRSRGPTLLLGGSAAAVVLTAIWLNSDRHDEFTPQGIAEWRPRSDALLAAARKTLLTEIPPLSASVLDPILR